MPVTVTAAYASSSLPSGISGLIVEDQSPIKIGDSAWELIDSTERRLDLSALGTDYPLEVELEARDTSCIVRQGDSTVILASGAAVAMNARILQDGWRLVNVDSADEAYIAIKQDTAGTGTLVATRVDKVG